MPPGKAAKLSDEQIRLIARWIDAGAPADRGANDAAARFGAGALGVSAAGEIGDAVGQGTAADPHCGRCVHPGATGGEGVDVFAACRELEVDSTRDVRPYGAAADA